MVRTQHNKNSINAEQVVWSIRSGADQYSIVELAGCSQDNRLRLVGNNLSENALG